MPCVELLDIPLPAGPGILRLRGHVEDGVVQEAEVVTGLMHRGVEKLFESRDYRQILSLANRHDWLSSFDGEVSAARVIEDALGIVVPERAHALRLAISEVCRINHHLYWLGATNERAALTDALDRATGSRMHLMITRIGGLSIDLSQEWIDTLPLPELNLEPPGAGVAALSREQAIAYATSGVVARASGWARELRTYVEPVVRPAGDAQARFQCLLDEIQASVDFLRAVQLPQGPVSTKLPRTIRLPEGEYYGASETGTGINGYWIVSKGDVVPWRMKMRTASFNNARALEAALPGTRVEELPLAVTSFMLVTGDMDK